MGILKFFKCSDQLFKEGVIHKDVKEDNTKKKLNGAHLQQTHGSKDSPEGGKASSRNEVQVHSMLRVQKALTPDVVNATLKIQRDNPVHPGKVSNTTGDHRSETSATNEIESIVEPSKEESFDDTEETAKASCLPFEELFAGLHVCSAWKKFTEGEKLSDDGEEGDLLAPLKSVPSEISFAAKPPSAWEQNHVLLTEIEDIYAGSLLQRMRRRAKAQDMTPRTKIYVETPGTRCDQASVSISVLTEKGGA